MKENSGRDEYSQQTNKSAKNGFLKPHHRVGSSVPQEMYDHIWLVGTYL